MFDFNLDNMSLHELRQLHKDVLKAISNCNGRIKSEAQAKVKAFASELGFTPFELFGAPMRSLRSSVAIKYQHPENHSLTWTGRGRRPNWLIESLSSGNTLEDLEVQQVPIL